MTMHNIITGFEATGIYPLDRSKLKQQPAKAKADNTGLSYLPLLSPAPKRKGGTPSVPSFSSKEMTLFHERYQAEMKDCQPDEDERYRVWLKMYQPEVESRGRGLSSMDDCFIHTPVKEGAKRAKVAVLACRMPEGGKWMVCCDKCNVWYHEGCVPVPSEVRNDECNEVPWLCPQCKEGIYILCTILLTCILLL